MRLYYTHKMENGNKYTAQFKLTVIKFAEEHDVFRFILATKAKWECVYRMCYALLYTLCKS